MAASISVQGLSAWYGRRQVLKDIEMEIKPRQVTAIIGPSGCGKSTFIRCLNRMHEVVPGARVTGRVLIEGEDIYAEGVEAVDVRHRVGMVFQRANPFPTMSVFDNVAAGLRLRGHRSRAELHAIVEDSLRRTTLYDELKGRLHESGASLSGGQQQRLCIARALAVRPDVLLMDEPCSALDPVATARIEDLIGQLKEQYTIIIVTHNMQQAARVAEETGFLLDGELVEFGPTERIFTRPADRRTEDYITGRFG